MVFSPAQNQRKNRQNHKKKTISSHFFVEFFVAFLKKWVKVKQKKDEKQKLSQSREEKRSTFCKIKRKNFGGKFLQEKKLLFFFATK